MVLGVSFFLHQRTIQHIQEPVKTVRVSAILDSVEKALDEYSGYVGNKLQREEIRKKESDERTAYIAEKRRHQIKLELRREK